MSFIKFPSQINVDNDISIVDPEMEKKPKFTIAGEIVQDAVFNHISLLLTTIISTLNLIYVGHIPFDNMQYPYKLFNMFQVGVFYLFMFGLIYSLGILKTVNYHQDKSKQYLNIKILLYCLCLFIILPFSLFSFSILKWLYCEGNDDILSTQVLWFIYTKFLIFAPIFCFFFLLFLLNIKYFQRNGLRAPAAWFCLLFIFIHCLLSYFLLFQMNYIFEGIILSLTITSLICYICSNMTISDELTLNSRKYANFLFIPNTNNIDENFKQEALDSLYIGLNLVLDWLPNCLFVLFSYFTGDTSFTLNIILENLFSILHIFSSGLSSTLKNYILYSSIGNKHSHQAKIKYVKIFSLVVVITASVFSLILITFGSNLIKLYLHSNPIVIKKEFDRLYLFFTGIIFFDFISMELEGYVKGINIQTNLLLYKIIFPLVFIPLGFALCFLFGYGILGLWIGMFLNILFYTIPNSINVYKHYDLFFQR